VAGGSGGVAGGSGGVAGGSGGVGGGSGGASGASGASGGCGLDPDAGSIGKWPDSKTKFCAGSSCSGGQDGDYEFHVPTYTVNGSSVIDSVTGLEWEKSATPSLEWVPAGEHCAALGSGWRLPTRLELISLMDYGSADAANAALPKAFVPSTGTASYWSSSESAKDPKNAWFVNFDAGGASPFWAKQDTGLLSELSVRCVKGPTLAAAPFVENQACDVVSSPSSGLMWQRSTETTLRDWPGALAYCEGLKHAGFDDWRLPNEKELSTIVDDKRASPAIDPAFGSTPGDTYWSSSPNRKAPSDARIVGFDDGSHYTLLSPSVDMIKFKARARCLRNL
jgi:hypothetical protein